MPLNRTLFIGHQCICRIMMYLLPLALLMSGTAQAQVDNAGAEAKGVPVTITLMNAIPDSEVTVNLSPGTLFRSIAPEGEAAPWFKGIKAHGTTLRIKLTTDMLPAETYPTLRFRGYMEFGGNSGGKVELGKPQVFVLNTPYGTVSQQSGDFSFNISNPPPTCSLCGCSATASCPADERGNQRSCLQYYSANYCCVVSPFPY